MNKITIIGIGNCGSQIANLAEQKYPNLFTSIYINSSDADLSMVKSETSLKFKIGDTDKVEGSGKNREKMKGYLEDAIYSILKNESLNEILTTSKYCFVCSSTAGGTGSGSTPIMMEFLRSIFPDCHFILVAVLPKYDASLMELGNTLEFLDELYGTLNNSMRVTYMMYDNDTASDLPPTKALIKVNEDIVEDIRVLTGIDCYPTPFDSIDDADMESIITTPGRLIVARIPADKKSSDILTEKNMEDCDLGDEFIKVIKKSSHAEIDRDKRVIRRGVITYFTPEVNELYNGVQKLDEFLGSPVESFQHNAINNDAGESMNFMYIVASGLNPINDRSNKINKRHEELSASIPKENEYILGNKEDVSTLGMRNKMDADAAKRDDVIPEDIFAKFKRKK